MYSQDLLSVPLWSPPGSIRRQEWVEGGRREEWEEKEEVVMWCVGVFYFRVGGVWGCYISCTHQSQQLETPWSLIQRWGRSIWGSKWSFTEQSQIFHLRREEREKREKTEKGGKGGPSLNGPEVGPEEVALSGWLCLADQNSAYIITYACMCLCVNIITPLHI